METNVFLCFFSMFYFCEFAHCFSEIIINQPSFMSFISTYIHLNPLNSTYVLTIHLYPWMSGFRTAHPFRSKEALVPLTCDVCSKGCQGRSQGFECIGSQAVQIHLYGIYIYVYSMYIYIYIYIYVYVYVYVILGKSYSFTNLN